MSETKTDFVVLLPDGTVAYGRRRDTQSILTALDEHIPDLGTQGLGRLRMYFCDTFTPEMPANDLANRVIDHLGYTHRTGWYGPVAVSMEEDWSGEIPEMDPAVVSTISGLASTASSVRS